MSDKINLKDPVHLAGIVLSVALLIGIGLYIYITVTDARYDRESAIELIGYQNQGGDYVP